MTEFGKQKAKNRGCVDLNTSSDILYCNPKDCGFSATKIAPATEELYDNYRKVNEKYACKSR